MFSEIEPGKKFADIADRVITVNGFSKSVAMTGWHLGYLAASEEVVKNIRILNSHTITGTSPFIQEAAAIALDCQDEMENMRRIYEARRNAFISGLNQIPGVTAEYPDGAFYARVKIQKNGMDSFEIKS